ncbi:hypothetical protein [Thalassotalea mangrovi]|uniref:Uncharacterized protein n=1 Tax=Thalassotalea mangrovi TaxID=2572245 RepID=A0A4U1BB82_9GAMM|nr:hypothetical protein [Thalassotalea mangrovi]TKB47428.1 hypothetical protein E8M12_01165 [Thalassotalea mangrovi]
MLKSSFTSQSLAVQLFKGYIPQKKTSFIMAKPTSTLTDQPEIDNADSEANRLIELEQQMIWVQMRKTVPGFWFIIATTIWLTSCCAYLWETVVLSTRPIDMNGLWLLSGSMLPMLHYAITGVVPFNASRYSRNLLQPTETIRVNWRFYAWMLLAAILYMAICYGAWLFAPDAELYIPAYSLLALIILWFTMLYRQHYQRSIQPGY